MLNFPFYNKHNNHIILDKKLRDYTNKSNMSSFNKFSQHQKNKNKSLLTTSLINYRNYSDTFVNNKINDSELEKEDYLCNFCDLSDNDCYCYHFSGNNSNHNNTNDSNTKNSSITKKMCILIGGTTSVIGLGIGFAVFYYKYFNLTNK